ncbi:uncharacterized protein LOC134180420 [Corticium candelabrum]|uniref:uncharacterized protein LOC134180420 n=1 Tax=Corticium candelabrum TaxID=121492 RepID=UPI002E26F7CA|nr:uncharacterized protein LOC134180420 [Corticium candelabrum]
MQLLQACLLATVVSLCVGAAFFDQTSKSSKSSTDNIQSSVKGSIIKKKPTVPQSSGNGATLQRQTTSVGGKKIRRPPTISNNQHPSCSPYVYRIQLTHGNCSRTIHTKMCYGKCISYTLPDKQTFSTPRKALSGVEDACNCCKSTRMSIKRYSIKCDVVARGQQKTKTFYVPSAEGCSCRPCS